MKTEQEEYNYLHEEQKECVNDGVHDCINDYRTPLLAPIPTKALRVNDQGNKYAVNTLISSDTVPYGHVPDPSTVSLIVGNNRPM